MNNRKKSKRQGQTVTERVDAMLIQGCGTPEILAKVPTTSAFIAKRACELKKVGKISGDRRSSIGKIPASSNEMSDKIHSERMKAYRMLDVPEKQLRILDEGRIDIPGLLKMRADARALNHDVLTEEVAKEFPNLASLKEYVAFFRDVRSTDVRHPDYRHVMNNITNSLTLDEHISILRRVESEIEKDIGFAKNELARLNKERESEEIRKNSLIASNYELQAKHDALVKSFTDIGEGKKYRQELYALVRSYISSVLESSTKWNDTFEATAAAALKFPSEFNGFSRAFKAGDRNYMRRNAESFGKVIMEAMAIFQSKLENQATEELRRQIQASIHPPPGF